jgi:hypothetical protein
MTSRPIARVGSAAIERRRAKITAQIAALGLPLPGSLVERRTRCGNTGCHCHGAPPAAPRALPDLDPQGRQQDRHPHPGHHPSRRPAPADGELPATTRTHHRTRDPRAPTGQKRPDPARPLTGLSARALRADLAAVPEANQANWQISIEQPQPLAIGLFIRGMACCPALAAAIAWPPAVRAWDHCDLATQPGAGLLNRLTRSWVLRPSRLEPVEDVLRARCRPQGRGSGDPNL